MTGLNSVPGLQLDEALWKLEAGAPGERLLQLVELGVDKLPWPGEGNTLARFRALARVGAEDLSLAKLFEGHTDALAILHELGAAGPPAGSTLGTWAAEGPKARLELRLEGGRATLHGRKSWCSGAASLSHALLTVWNGDRRPLLAWVSLRGPGVNVTDEGFHAVGMAATRSVDVLFEGAEATVVGEPGDYLSRVGFWHGALGIAACWYGAATALARPLLERARAGDEVLLCAHLGAVDVALSGARAQLELAADAVDAHPHAQVQVLALRTRAVVEAAAVCVLEHVGRALGAGPFCRDPTFAQLAADLPVFLRQSHAERDLATLGQLLPLEPGWGL